jgi:exopolysaccharide biosynthesis polyprenyl glycosylphosphotransferase
MSWNWSEVSSLPNPRQSKLPDLDWAARLIPGMPAALRASAKNGSRSVQVEIGVAPEYPPSTSQPSVQQAIPESAFSLLLPSPLKSRSAASWLRSLILDFTLVGLNWLLIGAVALPVHMAFPQAHLLDHRPGASFPLHLLGVALLWAALITLFGYSEGLYARGGDLRTHARSLAKAVLWSTTLLCIAQSLQGAALGSILVLCVGGVLHFASLLAWRWEDLRGGCSRPGQDTRNVLILGAGDVGRRVASRVESHPEGGRVVCGFLDDDQPLGNGVIGRVNDLARLARTGFVDEVILATPHNRDLTLRALNEARRLRLDVEMAPDLFGCAVVDGEVERLGDLPVICLHEERLPAGALLLKRFVDVVGSSLALVGLSPLWALIAILIRLDSTGSVIYAALRAGRKGKPFRCYKFRTMVSNADDLKHTLRNHNQRSGPFFKIAGDPRITRLGHFLRRYSLDELPQLWNVLKGDMSLVGPRPHPMDDFAAYEVEHLARLDVMPGITGLWQVKARRDPSFQKGVELDREYIRSWSLGMDVRILLQTLRAVAQGSGD